MSTPKKKNNQGFHKLPDDFEMLSVLSLAVDASSCGISVADAREKDMPLIYVNEAFVKLSGYQPHEVLGKNCRFLQGKEKQQQGLSEIRKAIKAKKTCVAQIKNFRKDGSMFWNELRLAPVFDSKQNLVFYIGVQTNITERIQLHEAREDYLKDLEAQVRQRTETLEKKNIALTEVLTQIENEKKKMNQQILENVDSVVIPMVQKLKSKLPEQEVRHIDLIVKSLHEITSPFGSKITRKFYKLTPKEIEVCNLIRGGATTKEIAELHHISVSTVENQRNQIRKKLGISKADTNLAAFLKSLDQE